VRAVVQVVHRAEVRIVGGEKLAEIGEGICAFVAIHRTDTVAVAGRLVEKLANARLLPDGGKPWSLSLRETGAELLLVSNFTLYGDLSKGRRPSWSLAMAPPDAEPLYQAVVDGLRGLDLKVSTGAYGAEMDVELANWGPSTIVLDIEA
jgi:D-tyrosyl-tRNA(Tyr) deacylase